MSLGTRYSTIRERCPYCGKVVSASWTIRHKLKCKLQYAPITELTRGEAKEAGRYEEFKQALIQA